MIESPSGGVPEKAPRWDLTRAEACGSGKVFLVCPLVYWEYLGIYGANIRVRRATGGGGQACRPPPGGPLGLVALSWLLWPPPEASWLSSGPRKILKKFRSVWNPFGIDFL